MVTDTPAVVASPAAAPDAAAHHVDGIDDEFFALVYSDEELLRGEFEQLMAAAWSSPPPTAGRDKGAQRPPDRLRPPLPPLQHSSPAGLVIRVRGRGVRTRSPPNITSTSRQD